MNDQVGRTGEEGRPLWLTIVVILGLIPLAFVVVADLDLESQAIFACLTILALFVINWLFEGRRATLILVILSIVVSSRYIWWRITSTLDFTTFLEAFLGYGLLLAEIYAWIVLLLSYLQTAWPLERKPEPLPDDFSLWPTVDVFIPTYNEPLSVVRITVLGALNMDYPRDRMRVHILDDGRREEFRQFAAEAGVGYITRDNNLHAKAGNLNAALQQTDGELIAVFDSDHVPTRAFLQMTVGWFLRDERLAVAQTPHHFYSPDPFGRNLATGYAIPPEGALFYGLVQEGNDFWNAAFFCGSSAVVRRSAIESIGGFATETVTEDAHTALRLHRAGFSSAYIRVPLAAGLSTERLALHMGQRMRWARGMTQIFRVDNPLLGRGLSVAQRLCYLNALLHFFFALPRFVFLTAPLAYLLFQQNIITTSALAILAYAGPHLIHAVVTNSRIQSRYRHSFWGEVYESVLTFYLLKPTLITLINPRRGAFNVTEKGGLLPDSYFDRRLVLPQIILIVVLSAALLIGFLRLFLQNLSEGDVQVLALNMAWAIFNLLTLGAAVAVAREARQIRSHVRLKIKVPAVIYLPDGRTVMTQSEDISMGGAYFLVRRPDGVLPDDRLDIELPAGSDSVVLPARLISWEDQDLRVTFELATIADYRRLVRVVFGRADAWLSWDEYAPDRPLRAARSIFVNIAGLFYKPRVRAVTRRSTDIAGGPTPPAGPSGRPSLFSRRSRGSAPAAIVLAALMSLLLLGSGTSSAQQPRPLDQPAEGPRPTGQATPSRSQPVATTTPPAARGTAPGRPGELAPANPFPTPAQRAYERANSPVALDGSEGVPGQQGVPGQPRPSGQVVQREPRGFAFPRPGALPGTRPGEPARTATAAQPELVPQAQPDTGGARMDSVTLKDLGEQTPIRLQGVQDDAGRDFSVRRDEVVTAANVNLNCAYSPALIPELSHLHVFVNNELIGSIQLVKELSESRTVRLPVNHVLFQEDNNIRFNFVGHYTLGCEDPLHSTLWAIVSNTTAIEMRKERLPLRNDLSLLPLPFFDRRDLNALSLPFVFADTPSTGMLQAAGTVASYFGNLASYRGATFPVSFGQVPAANAVVFATATARPSGLSGQRIEGPSLSVITNPYNPNAKLLLVMGRSDEELQAAARTLALGARTLSGPVAVVAPPALSQRQAFDAPKWLPNNRPVRMGELVAPAALIGHGLYPGVLTVNFQAAPGYFAWREAGIPLVVRYRYPSGQWIDWTNSRLDVLINNFYLKSLPLEQNTTVGKIRESLTGRDFTINEGTVNIPPYLITGRNQLQYFFDLKPYIPGYCERHPPENIQVAIDPDSSIDFSNTLRYAPLPNLAFFVNSGYPFTRMADLSETAVVLPDQVAPAEVEAYLGIFGMMGDATGYPATRHEVATASQVETVRTRDLLIVGSFQRQPLIGQWAQESPFRVENGQLRVRMSSPIERIYTILDTRDPDNERRMADQLLVSTGDDVSALVSYESPLAEDRTVVAVSAAQPDGVVDLANAIRSTELRPVVQGDLVVLRGNQLSSFRVGGEYARAEENLPLTTRVRWWFSDKPLLLVLFLLLGVFLIALALFWLLRRLASLRLRSRSRAA